MEKAPKQLGKVGPFEIYKLGRVLIIYENGEFCCNKRPCDPGYANPIGYYQAILEARAEYEADKAANRAGFQRLLAKARADRAAELARQAVLAF